MKTSEILKAAQTNIEVPEHWTQEENSRPCQDRKTWTDPLSEDAYCFCSIGAIERAIGGDLVWYVRRDVEAAFGMERALIEQFNDNHTHTQVIALFDKAIASAEAREAA